MIDYVTSDYIPADVPPAIVEFADKKLKKYSHYPKNRAIRYLTSWKKDLELYLLLERFEEPLISKTKLFPRTTILVYDCHEARMPTIDEIWDINLFIPKYLMNAKIKSEHVCHRDLEAYNQHNMPNLDNKKEKYFTPNYIPKAVVQYINEKYPVSWYPGLYNRYTKYLSTYEDRYEVYFVYWANPKDKNSKETNSSMGKYVLYDCKTVRGYKDNKERIDISCLIPADEQYYSKAKPTFCKSQKK